MADVSLNDPEMLSFDEIHDAVSFLSLHEDQQNSVISGTNQVADSQVDSKILPANDVPPRIFQTEISETRMCQICFVYKEHCSCPRQCSTCSVLVHPGTLCKCDELNVSVLRTRVSKEVTDESDEVLGKDQVDISKMVEDKFELYNLVPPEVSDQLNTDMDNDEEKKVVDELVAKYPSAFSTHKYDTGVFKFFDAELDAIPGSSVIEKERPVKPHIVRELAPIVDQLVKADIIQRADYQGPWLSNAHAVPKPTGDHHLAGKASAYILRQQGADTNHSRLTLDLRALNAHAVSRPRVNLPSYADLIPRFKDMNVRIIDLTSMYWSIHVSQSSQHLSNFWWNHETFKFLRLPQGWVNSCFVASKATQLAFGQQAMLAFLEHKGWTLDSEEWPYNHVSQFLIIYMDDLSIQTTRKVKNHVALHGRVLEFLLFSCARAGFKIEKNKFSPFVKSFKFLGHQFNTEAGITSIPPVRLEAIKNFRVPRSCAELLSRLSVLRYHRRYLLLMKLISAPLQ